MRSVISALPALQRSRVPQINERLCDWVDCSREAGRPLWQHRRWLTVFSEDGGLTWWDVMQDGREVSP